MHRINQSINQKTCQIFLSSIAIPVKSMKKEAKKEKKLAVSLPLNRRALKLHLQNRRGHGLLCIVVPEVDTVNLVIFLDNV